METKRKLINYLPPFMQDFKEMNAIMDVEQVEVDNLWLKTENAIADQFIPEATEYGVKRWESMLGISTRGTDTLDVRKFRILTRLNQELPYTVQKLKQVLSNICGNDMFSIEVNAAEYYVNIKLGVENDSNYQEVVNVLTKMLPANMIQYVTVMYNNNSVLSPFTHAQLVAYTHDQLRKEVFE